VSTPFDEAFEADGRLRPAYEALRRRLGGDALRPPAEVSARLRERPLGDDARILAIPLVLEESEYGAIQAAVAQRARALQSFFCDAVMGDGRFLASGRGLAPALLDEILACEGTSLAQLRRAWGSHEPDEIRFVYGPDLAREPSGRWVVLEDNVGCVGGAADGFFVADAYARAAGQPAPTLETADLARAVEHWLGPRAHRSVGEPIIASLGCEPGGGDSASPRLRENARRARLLAPLGIEAVGGAELERLLRPGRTRPGALVNFEHLAAHLVGTVFGRLRIPLLNSPGTGLLGNKALLPFVGDMIRFFCGEEPLLATPSTRILRDGESPEPRGDWVVKMSTGAGGNGVFLPGSEMAGRLESVHALVRASGPCGVVAQRFVEPSTLSLAGRGARDAHRVELRPMTYVVGWEEVLVGEQPVGKAVSSFGRPRLNNVSRGAAYVAVLRETAPGACPRQEGTLGVTIQSG